MTLLSRRSVVKGKSNLLVESIFPSMNAESTIVVNFQRIRTITRFSGFYCFNSVSS